MTLVRFFDEPSTLDEVGGKAVNLSRLSRAGFPVPPGFAVTTEAFRTAVHEHGLRDLVNEALAGADPDNPDSVDDASARIRAAFAEAPITTLLTEPVAQAVLDAYRQMGGGAVAVRSSATAEDLPDLSFAGQQDTLLGVTDEAALLAAVVECWSEPLDHAGHHVPTPGRHPPRRPPPSRSPSSAWWAADTSGVLFTANPLTGHRGADGHRRDGSGWARPWSRAWSNRTTSSRTRSPAGSSPEPSATRPSRRRRSPAAVSRPPRQRPRSRGHPFRRRCARAGRPRSAGPGGVYGTPQDIEWAIAGGEVALLQARAITSLFPIPDGAPTDAVYLSFGAVQGMLAPITPLGGDAIRCVMAGGASVFGSTLEPESNPYIGTAGERLWIRVDRALRNPLGSRVLPGLLKAVDPSARRILLDLREEGVLTPLPREARRAVAPSWPGSPAWPAGTSPAPSGTRRPSGPSSTRSPRPPSAAPRRPSPPRATSRTCSAAPHSERGPSARPCPTPSRPWCPTRASSSRSRPRAPGTHPALRRHRRG